MKNKLVLLFLFVCSTIISGCISGSDTYGGDLQDLLFSVDDLPEGYVMEIDDPIYEEEMSEELLDKGYAGGHVRFFTLSNDEVKATLGLTIQRYDLERVSEVLEYAKMNRKESSGVEELEGTEYGNDSFILHSQTSQNEFYVIMFYEKDIIVQVFHNGLTIEPDLDMISTLAKGIADDI